MTGRFIVSCALNTSADDTRSELHARSIITGGFSLSCMLSASAYDMRSGCLRAHLG